jgi:NCS1 family nucleobase:cation symporter-1
MVDYFLVRRTVLKTGDLFRLDSQYGYGNGWNSRAIVALLIGVLPNLPGFFKQAGFIASVPGVFEALYTYAWFVGLAVSSVVYLLLMRGRR